MKILTVGVDPTTVQFLRANGIQVDEQSIDNADDLTMWLEESMHFDTGVINLEKSRLGIYAARVLRKKKIQTPIIGITQGSEERMWSDQRTLFLENGGDDLLRHPVNPRELIATIRAVCRRSKAGAAVDIVEFAAGKAKLKINFTTRSAMINNEYIHLTPKEVGILLLLTSRPDHVLTKEAFISHLYVEGVDDEPELKIVDVFMCKLRRKLATAHEDAAKFIETVWGQGYRFASRSGANRVPPAAETSATLQ